MGYPRTNLSAATVATSDRFLLSVSMKVGAYTLDNTTMPTAGARHVTLTRTVGAGADTPGTVVIVGKNLANQTITETLIPGANAILVTGTKWFASVTSATGVGWVTAGAADTIVIGCAAEVAVAEGAGVFHAIVVNTTAAGVITIKDAAGTNIAVLPANVAVGTYTYDANFSGYLDVSLAAASNVTVLHTQGLPTSYALS